jgi:hypothetical protein
MVDGLPGNMKNSLQMAAIKDLDITIKIFKYLTGLAIIDGILCLILLLLIPSDSQTAWLFGYSRSRILMLVVCGIGILIFTIMYLGVYFKAKRVLTTISKLNTILVQERASTIAVIVFLTLLILSVVYLIFALTNLDYVVPSDAVTSMEQVKAYIFRLSPFVLWIALLCTQILIALTFLGYTTTHIYLRATQFLSIIIWPVLLVVFWGANRIDPFYYVTLTKEDNLVEWATVFFFVITGIFSLAKYFRSKKRSEWFYLLFGVGCMLFALEEISWGQRIFGLESSEFFLENSDQQEINIHNVVNEWFSVRTKNIAALVFFSYGAVFPLAALNHHIRNFAQKWGILIPPLILIPGFVLASFLTVDLFFTGQDEEVAELFLSMLLFLTILFQFLDSSNNEQ